MTMNNKMMENLLNMTAADYIGKKILEMNGTIVRAARRGENKVRFDWIVLKVTADEENHIIGFFEDVFEKVYNDKNKNEFTVEW